MKQACIYANSDKDTISTWARGVAGYLLSAGYQVYCQDDMTDTLGCPPATDSQGPMDLAFILGGDGTVLTALFTGNLYDVPMCCINMGYPSFLLEHNSREFPVFMDQILAGDYEIESREMLSATVRSQDGRQQPIRYALNDVNVVRSSLGGVMPVQRMGRGRDGFGVCCRRHPGSHPHRLHRLLSFGGRPHRRSRRSLFHHHTGPVPIPSTPVLWW